MDTKITVAEASRIAPGLCQFRVHGGRIWYDEIVRADHDRFFHLLSGTRRYEHLYYDTLIWVRWIQKSDER